MKLTFADSYYFLALFNPQDAAHERAVAAAQSLKGGLLTTDWIVVELADALSDPVNRTGCAKLIADLRSSPLIEIVPGTRETLDAGLRLYADRPDKNWSLTDCISFVVMHEKGTDAALTGDHHFAQAGFQALLA